MPGEHKMTVRLPVELHRRVKAKAALQGRTLSDVFRELLERWEKGEIELPSTGEQRSKPEQIG